MSVRVTIIALVFSAAVDGDEAKNHPIGIVDLRWGAGA